MRAWNVLETVAGWVAWAGEVLGYWLLAGVVVWVFLWVTRPLRPYDIEPRMVNPQDWGRR